MTEMVVIENDCFVSVFVIRTTIGDVTEMLYDPGGNIMPPA